MKRVLLPSIGLLAVLGLATVAGRADAATFDAASGTLSLSSGVARAVSFDDVDAIKKLSPKVAKWAGRGGFSLELAYSDATNEALAPFLASGDGVALEGKGALRIGKDANGLVFFDRETFDGLRKARFEVTFWAKAEGIGPSFLVAYGRTDDDVYTKDHFPFAQVRAIRTGKQTSDGWAEFSTGTLDGEVYGVGVRAIGFVPRNVDEGDTFLLDALEIRKVEGKPVEPVACTQDDVATTCGSEGDCIFSHCVPSSVTWGPLPSLAHRKELVDRWSFVMTKVHGDRKAVSLAQQNLVPAAKKLAEEAKSSRQIVGGLVRLVNETRDNHTSFGSPSNFTFFNPQVVSSSSAGLGCFGVVEKDLLGGGTGYGIFQTDGTRLKVGDVLQSIDGQDPKQWVDKHYPSFARTLPNDPRSDFGETANALAELLVSRAKTFTVTRCASATACSGADRTEVVVDVGDLVYKSITEGTTGGGGSAVQCTARFKPSVANARSRSSTGEDNVSTEVQASGEVSVQFDGFSGQSGWETQMNDVFKNAPAKVLMDAREGHGGYYSAIDYLFAITRGASEPFGVVSIGRGGHDDMDPLTIFSRARACTGASSNQDISCIAANIDGFFSVTGQADPPGMQSKIAWLNTVDVSANDYMPKLLQGRSKFRIFAPHPTAGAFGAVVQMPSVLPGFSGGSIQIQDSRFAKSYAETESARWESGHGVEPDEVVAQKQSDLLLDEDTMLKVARAWLEAP